jgi:hypothetical protein
MSQSITRNFSRFFGIFWVFSVPLNIFWGFPEFILHWKIISEKTKPILSYPGRARRPDPVHPGPAARPARPISYLGEADRAMAMAAAAPWRAHHARLHPAPYKRLAP